MMSSPSALPRNQYSGNALKSLSAILGDRNGYDRNGSRTVNMLTLCSHVG